MNKYTFRIVIHKNHLSKKTTQNHLASEISPVAPNDVSPSWCRGCSSPIR